MCNRCPTKILKLKTPQEARRTQTPGVSHLRVFGSIAYAKIPEANKTKLEDKGVKCVLVGYGDRTMGYRLYNLVTHKIFHSRDVVFEKNKSQSWDQTETTMNIELSLKDEEQVQTEGVPMNPEMQASPSRGFPSPQRSESSSPIIQEFSDMVPRRTRTLDDLYQTIDPMNEDFIMYCLQMSYDPISFKEANQQNKWKVSMDE